MDERRTISIQLSRVNADIARFLGRLVAEEDPTNTVEYTVSLGRAAHLLGLHLQRTAIVLAAFSRFEDSGPESEAVDDVEADEVDTASYETVVNAGIDALSRNPHFTPELLNELFGDAAKAAISSAAESPKENAPRVAGDRADGHTKRVHN
ncbi:hypothetical protein [Saccharothrix sp. Mg75]|uniref:hypothetical protein n=1 Tax=Saccharothrix sp. Mg75 TaxID=3445357 RepID=UPI003EEFB4AC